MGEVLVQARDNAVNSLLPMASMQMSMDAFLSA